MTSVHYFPRYSQKENFVTNNSLLLLTRLHSFSRLKFEKLISLLCAENEIDPPDIGLVITQQAGTGKSVLDGFISQRSFRLAIETKTSSEFHLDQLQRHLSIFESNCEQQYLLLLSNEEKGVSSELRDSLLEKIPKGVELLETSFEKLIQFFRGCITEYDEEMVELVADYEAFCSEMKILSTDQDTMFVPPCGRSFGENIEYKLYYCPSSWNRRNVRYLGIYKNKAVQAIGVIAKTVRCDLNLETGTVDCLDKGVILTSDEKKRILGAAQSALKENGWNLSTGTQFFLCDEMEICSFKKRTPQGIMGHRYINIKKYFSKNIPKNLTDVAFGLSNSDGWD